MEIQENIALAPLTTLRVGGSARYFIHAQSSEDVEAAVNFAEEKNLPLFVLGGGSNVLISDKGWPGLVLQIGISGIDHTYERQTIRLIVGAGEDWDPFVAFCVTRTSCWGRVPERNSGKRWGDAGAKRWSLWPGSFANHRLVVCF